MAELGDAVVRDGLGDAAARDGLGDAAGRDSMGDAAAPAAAAGGDGGGGSCSSSLLVSSPLASRCTGRRSLRKRDIAAMPPDEQLRCLRGCSVTEPSRVDDDESPGGEARGS